MRSNVLSFSVEKKISGIARKSKDFYHSVVNTSGDPLVLFVVGCQRSGTTAMIRVLEKDWNIKVYPENSELTVERGVKYGLKPLAHVKNVIRGNGYPVSVVKPLIETQRITEFFRLVDGSKALWMYRHYRDVAASNLKKFGMENGIRDIRPIAEGVENNWRSAVVPGYVADLVRKHYSEDMNPYDAACLFWLARNSLFLEYGLQRSVRVHLVQYERFATKPTEVVSGIYEFIGRKFPGNWVAAGVVPTSLGTGKGIELNPEIESACEALWYALNRLEDSAL